MLAGTVVRGLEGFDHPALHYDGHWDLANAWNTIRELSGNIILRSDRALVEDVVDHLTVRAPLLEKLPKQVIHGDINDLNVLVADGEIAGLIDFGDSPPFLANRRGRHRCHLRHARTDDPIAVAEDVVTGYVEVAHATRDEADAIYDLIRARLAVSVCVAASRRHLGNDHHMVSEDDAWELLERLDYVDAVAAAARLVAAAGYERREPTEHDPRSARPGNGTGAQPLVRDVALRASPHRPRRRGISLRHHGPALSRLLSTTWPTLGTAIPMLSWRPPTRC